MASSVSDLSSPFHEGEQELQRRNGKRDAMEAFGRQVIRPYMPDQHRAFYAQLPFIAAGAADADGWPWATLLTGPPGFIGSPDPEHLTVALTATGSDPVHAAIRKGAPAGLLGIELHSRRRNRVNGRAVSVTAESFTLKVDQAFGNCPQYIQLRELEGLDTPRSVRPPPLTQPVSGLQGRPEELIRETDIFFVSSYIPAGGHPAREGADVSHRGGRPGLPGDAGCRQANRPPPPGRGRLWKKGRVSPRPSVVSRAAGLVLGLLRFSARGSG